MTMVGKEVIYNGGKDSYYGCTEPTALIKGKRYKVVGENDRGWQTDLRLEGEVGEFNSVWFNEAEPKRTFFAITIEYHDVNWYVGKRISLAKLHKKEAYFETVTTSPVLSVEHIYGNMYKIETKNSVYITEVERRTVGN